MKIPARYKIPNYLTIHHLRSPPNVLKEDAIIVMSHLKINVDSLEDPWSRLADNMNKLERNMNKLSANMDKPDENIDKPQQNMDKLDENINKPEGNMGKLDENIDKLNGNLDQDQKTSQGQLAMIITPQKKAKQQKLTKNRESGKRKWLRRVISRKNAMQIRNGQGRGRWRSTRMKELTTLKKKPEAHGWGGGYGR